MKKLKHFVFDLVGVFLIVISPLLGWLPGPGGIPLFLAGLGLLSVHHAWAKKTIRYVKKNGIKLGEQIFREHTTLQAVYDVLTVVFMAGGVYLLNTYTRSLTLSLSIFFIFTGLTLFFGNRKRLDTFTVWLRNRFQR